MSFENKVAIPRDQLEGLQVPVFIEKTNDPADLAWCANLMAANEPWLTLQRNYDDSLQLLTDPLSEVYLVSEAGTRAGFIMIKMKGSFTGYIQSIAFDAPARGRGIGQAVIGYIETLIFQAHPNVFICVSSFNTRAQQLYLRLGYEVIGTLKDYVIRGHDEILMRKTRGSLHDFKKQKPANA
ncbi:MAG: putative acetyltransferase [Sediminibacterium sp.]|nr:putative acetyltransferase [Sediminibacterium sp.]